VPRFFEGSDRQGVIVALFIEQGESAQRLDETLGHGSTRGAYFGDSLDELRVRVCRGRLGLRESGVGYDKGGKEKRARAKVPSGHGNLHGPKG
jgi:hypothetical protein